MTQLSLLDPAPELLVATWDDAATTVRLHFDKPMYEIPVAGNDLFARFGNQEKILIFDEWEKPFRCIYTLDEPQADIGDDVVTYLDPIMQFIATTDWPLPFFTDFPLLIEPILFFARFTAAPDRLKLTFNRAMNNIPINGDDFFLRVGNQERSLTFNQWSGANEVLFNVAIVGADAGADVVSFISDFMPLKSAPGAPVADFVGFPVT